MIRNSSIFYAKILLFGEYSVIFNSRGLTIPYGHFRGELSFLDEDSYTDHNYAKSSNLMLKDFYNYLINSADNASFGKILNLRVLGDDIKNGLFFDSSIPQGYGLGSSGALVAAVYKKYGNKIIKGSKNFIPDKFLELKGIFSKLESFFHGTSSGIDPLNCYIKMPLLIEKDSTINIVGLPRRIDLGQSAIFLLNTELPRKTGPLVNYFLERCKSDSFFENSIKNELLPITDSCIDSFISGNVENFFAELYKLSYFQFLHLKKMIPDDYLGLWYEGLSGNEYYLKLCGAGGGGFILGFCKDFESLKTHFEKLGHHIIPVFRSFRQDD